MGIFNFDINKLLGDYDMEYWMIVYRKTSIRRYFMTLLTILVVVCIIDYSCNLFPRLTSIMGIILLHLMFIKISQVKENENIIMSKLNIPSSNVGLFKRFITEKKRCLTFANKEAYIMRDFQNISEKDIKICPYDNAIIVTITPSFYKLLKKHFKQK